MESITHSAEELAPFDCVADQYEFRRELVLDCLKRHSVPLDSPHRHRLPGRPADPPHRGGGLRGQRRHGVAAQEQAPERARLQRGRDDRPFHQPPAWHPPAYIYDGVTVDEPLPINKLTGLPSMRRKGMGHNLNTRAAALRYARENGRDYKDITVIVAHLGGGISVNLHHNGKIEDFINDEEGPFSPERAGGLPMFDVISECFSGRYDYKGMMKLVKEPGRPDGPPGHHRQPRGGQMIRAATPTPSWSTTP